jgi:hypothetical protein
VQVFYWQTTFTKCYQYSNNGKNMFDFDLACWNAKDMSHEKKNG